MAFGKRLALVAILQLTIAGLCFAQGIPVSNYLSMGWANLAGMALAIVVLLLAIGYMAGSLLSDEQLKAWTKRELGQAVFSALILVTVFVLIGSMDYWLKVVSLATPDQSPEWNTYVNNFVCCDPTQPGAHCVISPALARNRPCHIALAMDYLQVLYESGMTQMKTVVSHYWSYAFISGLTLELKVLFEWIANISWTPLAGLSITAEYYKTIFDLLFKTIILIRAQQMFLDFLWAGLFPYMLAAGLVLRIFYFTRKLGGLLIALGLSLFIVLPMFYVLSGAILFGFMGGWVSSAGYATFGNSIDQGTMPMPGQTDSVNTAPMSGNEFSQTQLNLYDACGTATDEEKTSQASFFDNIVSQKDTLLHSGRGEAEKGANDSRFGLEGPTNMLAALLFFTLVLPFMGLMLTLAAFKFLSPLIGGDVEISLLSRLI